MTANLKAPLVVNLQAQIGKQVVLQENEYTIKHLMFKELRTHLTTIASQRKSSDSHPSSAVVPVKSIPAEKAAEAFGGFIGMITQLDNWTSSVRTRELLRWEPTHEGLLDDLANGHYFDSVTA